LVTRQHQHEEQSNSPAPSSLPSPPLPSSVSKTIHFNITGLKHSSIVGDLNKKVMLVPDPNNVYDSNAVRVMNSDNQMIGYVKRALSHHIFLLLSNDQSNFATIN